MERARRDHAHAPTVPARPGHRYHRRRRRGGARGCPDYPLARRPALAIAGPQAEVRRAWLPYARRGTRADAEHGAPMVGRGYRRIAELNRMGMPTGQGKTWTAHRVSSVRRVN